MASRLLRGDVVSLHTDATRAPMLMNQTGNRRLPVADEGDVLGIITLKDLLKLLALEMGLGRK
jgi:CBS domain-containing protein